MGGGGAHTQTHRSSRCAELCCDTWETRPPEKQRRYQFAQVFPVKLWAERLSCWIPAGQKSYRELQWRFACCQCLRTFRSCFSIISVPAWPFTPRLPGTVYLLAAYGALTYVVASCPTQSCSSPTALAWRLALHLSALFTFTQVWLCSCKPRAHPKSTYLFQPGISSVQTRHLRWSHSGKGFVSHCQYKPAEASLGGGWAGKCPGAKEPAPKLRLSWDLGLLSSPAEC